MFLRVKNKIYSRLLALVILLIVTSWILVSKDMLAKNSEVFQVESGSSISDVAKELSDKRLIKSRLFFKSLSKFLGANKKLKSGYYQISPNMSILAFLDNISNGSVLTTKVTLIEGKTIKYYFEQLSLDPSLESKGSLEDVMQSIGVKAPYDGWFFPETYNFNYGESVENVLRRSYKKCSKKFLICGLIEIKDSHLSLHMMQLF